MTVARTDEELAHEAHVEARIAVGLGAFIWSLRSGQYEDLDGAAWRVIQHDEEKP